MSHLISTNPAKNYAEVGRVEISTDAEIREKVAAAHKANTMWKELGVSKRVKILMPVLEKLKEKKEELALLVTREIGKSITESSSDLDWDFGYFQWFLDNAGSALGEEIILEDTKAVHKVLYEPIGTASVITPWNFPFGMFMWGVVPNLLAGNTVVAKVSEECPLSGKFIEDVFRSASLPEGVFAEVYGDGQVGQKLVEQDIDLIWFTGSSAVGKKLYEIAGKKFIKAILEMGGSNPSIVFEDCDVEKFIAALSIKRLMNCGQCCDALKRLIVHESIFDAVVGGLRENFEAQVVGDPEDRKTTIGSLVAKRQLETLEAQVEDAKKKGATVVTGGQKPEGLSGSYYLPTLLTDVTRDMRVWKEEVFGPVLPVVSFKTEEEAIELAEDTVYGLGAQIYSGDADRALRVASKLKVGNIDINGASHWIPCNPFGGCKASGMGREHGIWGFRELCEVKQISVLKDED